MSISRRDFLGAGAAAAAGLALPTLAGAEPVISNIVDRAARPAPRPASRPVIISAANGMEKDPEGKQGIKVAWDLLAGGADPLDAIVAGVNVVELNPNDQSVGLGGLPDEDGVVQLDASCMHGPSKRAGAVGCLEDIADAAAVAKAVMDFTDHIFLVGEGAKRFAIEMGFKPQNLLTDKSRRDWLRWKADLNPDDNWLNLPARRPAGAPKGGRGGRDDETLQQSLHVYYDARGVPHTYGTINMNVVTASGDIASVTTTSGLSWKIPGRVGDSPIIGAGQYCDNEVGAAGSTGRGEANMKVCGGFLAVEFMRQGMSPTEACMKVMERVVAMTESRLLDEHGRPYFDLQYYAVNKKGEYGAAMAYQGADPDHPTSFAVCDDKGARLEPFAYMYTYDQRPKGRPMSGTLVIPK
ncbi:MAG: N(4)-(beta-N-acetylglucosaminyl)-L-asparaginase [Gemmatimonadota bacterium]|nr:N(4)-(beta-N-acetylglucosaminyl)-L-asparaginase [Gemmatimonadota bacterium]MDE3215145.1 N(4)-(beta-N-acetylglucosaminyl)-L-asparaginase [Gemmatimonadota bacterium]